MNNVNKTLYIPLYGKSYVSRKGILLNDPKAEEIWSAEGFALKGKSKSKWLAYFMAMRSASFDCWLQKQMDADPAAVVLHVGCGMDTPLEFLAYLNEQGIPTTVRQVIIPTLNDDEESISALKKIVAAHPCVDKVELLPFRKICQVKYDKMGIPFRAASLPEPSPDTMKCLEAILQA